MKQYQIILASKNKKSLKKFLQFFKKNLEIFSPNIKYFTKKPNKKVITILKSPHVNKKAQEQFQSNIYFKNLNINLPQNLKFLTFIKNIKSNFFLDVKVKVKIPVNNKSDKKILYNVFSLNNFNLNIINQLKYYKNIKPKQNLNNIFKSNIKTNTFYYKHNSLKTINTFLKIIDIYGELVLNNNNKRLDSSVGRAKD